MEVQIDGSEAEEEMSDDAAAADKLRLEGPSLKAAKKARAKGEIEEQQEDDEHTEYEGVAPKVARDPGQPTAIEKAAHNVTHVPYRSWCPHCVRGRAKGRQRRRLCMSRDDDIPHAAIDYTFLTENGMVSGADIGEEEKESERLSMTVLVMKDSTLGSVWAYPVAKKGSSDEMWVTEQMIEDLDTMGLNDCRLTFKADQEKSTGDLQNTVKRKRGAEGLGTAIENSPVGDSNNNGKVERAIQEVGGVSRTFRSALEARIGAKVGLDHPITPWLVRHAAQVITRYQIRSSGKTSYRRAKGYDSKLPVCEFGELIHFKPLKTTASEQAGSFEDRMVEGVWLGNIIRTGENIVAMRDGSGIFNVGSTDGVYKVGDIMRQSEKDRWSKEAIDSVRGTPKDPCPELTRNGARHKFPTYVKPNLRRYKSPAERTEGEDDDGNGPRRLQITRKDIAEHGPTDDCRGCRAIMRDDGSHRAHSEECRQRIEEAVASSSGGKDRVDRAVERMTRAIVEHSEAALERMEKARQDKEANEPKQPQAATGVETPRAQPSTPRPGTPAEPREDENSADDDMFMPSEDEAADPTVTYESDAETDRSMGSRGTSYPSPPTSPDQGPAPAPAPPTQSGSSSKRRAEVTTEELNPDQKFQTVDTDSESDTKNFGWTGFDEGDMDASAVSESRKKCLGCRQTFKSRNGLHQHLREHQEHLNSAERVGRAQACNVSVSTLTEQPGADDGIALAPLLESRQQGQGVDPKLVKGHPGQKYRTEDAIPADYKWRDIGSGIIARTILQAERFVTTTTSGPAMADVKKIIVRDARTGKVLDVCEPDTTLDRHLHRPFIVPTDIRVELHMKNADEMYRRHGPDVAEIYSQPRVAAEAATQRFGKRLVRPGWSLDITMPDPIDEQPWDLSKPGKQARLKELINTTEPYFLIGSPPCTPFSNLQNLNKAKRDPRIVKEELAAGRAHLKVCCAEYTRQHKAGRYFVHEHPHSASSWEMAEVQD